MTFPRLIAASALLLPSLVLAAEAEHAETQIDQEIFVTATRTDAKFDQVLGSVSVITRADIELSVAADAADLLRLEAGIDVVRSGPFGAQTSVFMRGTDSDHVLVLIDGINVGSPITGGALWADIPLDQIERIEIVRGPRSAQFGSDAIGGVIQLFTRKDEQLSIALTGGSYGTREVTVNGGVGTDYRLSGSLTHGKSDGFSATNSNSSSFDADNDGRENTSGLLSFSADISDSADAGLNYQYTKQNSEIDGFGSSELTNRTIQGGGWFELSGNGDTRFRAESGYLRQEIGTAVATRTDSSIQADMDLDTVGLFTLGLSQVNDHGVSPGSFDDTSSVTALFVQHQVNVKGVELVAAGRRDNHSRFGTHNTGSFSIGGWVSDSAKVFASYGSGFNAPTLNDLFHPGYCGPAAPCYAGNPDLKPELSQSVELGVNTQIGDISSFNIALFQTRIRDLIDIAASGARNISHADMKGVELSWSTIGEKWQFRTNATWQQARDASDVALLRRPERKLTARIDRDIGDDAGLGFEVITASEHRDFVGFTPGNVAGYGIINLHAHWQVSRHIQLAVRGENLTDKDYQTAYGFNNPGVSGFFTVTWKQ